MHILGDTEEQNEVFLENEELRSQVQMFSQAVATCPFPDGRHFRGSNFKREYERCNSPEHHQDEVLKAVRKIVYGHCDLHEIADGPRDNFLHRLFAEWGRASYAHEVLSTPAKTACLFWCGRRRRSSSTVALSFVRSPASCCGGTVHHWPTRRPPWRVG
jgi:hypothetical protein